MMYEAVSLLENITKLLGARAPEEYYSLQSVENDLGCLKKVFVEMESKQAEQWSGLDLKKLVKELVCDVQDIHECWHIIQVASNTTIGLSEKKVVYRLRREMESITRYRLEPLLRITRAYIDLQGQQEQPSKPNQVHLVQLNKEIPQVRVKKIVGFEDEANAVINCLMQDTEELDVICITGMHGIGKTTLAWKVYQSDTIRREFAPRIWVDIPHNFSARELYLNILREFIKKDMVDYNELARVLGIAHMPYNKDLLLEFLKELIERGTINDFDIMYAVRTCLENWRFLLVMDAVWTADFLKSVMDLQLKMGKVLITTCNNSVCKDAKVERKPHVLRFQTEKESWELLQLQVFGILGECPESLKHIGECIAQNCNGLPLAIVAVGASLTVASSSTVTAEYLNEQWWRKVSHNVMVYLADYDNQRAYKRIEFSYNKLTQSSQDCFLYIGVFPQGHEIPVRTMTRLWSAERLVRGSQSLTVEETAEQILHDLINKNMVMAGKIYPNGKIKTFRLHKLLYGFCKYKAAEQEFYHEIEMFEGGDVDNLFLIPPTHRRLCVYSHFSEFFSSALQERQVRTILCLNNKDKVVVHPEESSRIHTCFDSLRVLECRGVSFTKFPKKLNTMMLLKYISLSCDDLDVIPESISSLCYLETLVVDTQSLSITLEANIWRMLSLRHLVTKAAIVLAIRGNGEAGENLQTLSRLAPKCCTEDVFRRAPNLKTLGIKEHTPDLLSAANRELLRLLPNLLTLNLERLTLSGTCLGWECMSILGKIKGLEILKLKNYAFIGRSWNSTDADCFLCLGFLLITTTDLVCWEASPSCFPNLKHLVLNDCENLDKIPSTLAKSLAKVDVDKVSDSAAASAREIEQEIARRKDKTKSSDTS